MCPKGPFFHIILCPFGLDSRVPKHHFLHGWRHFVENCNHKDEYLCSSGEIKNTLFQSSLTLHLLVLNDFNCLLITFANILDPD